MSQKQTENTYAEEAGLDPVPLSVAALTVLLCFKDRHVPMLIGESGTGKTAIIESIGDLQDMDVIIYTLSHCEPSDLKGPMWPKDDGTFTTLPDGRIPFQGLPNVEDRAILFFDEFNRAEDPTINAGMSALQERRLGGHQFGPNVVMAVAINPPDGEYAVSGNFTSDPAIRRRTCQIAVHFAVGDFVRFLEDPPAALRHLTKFDKFTWDDEVFKKRKMEPRHPSVIGYLKSNPDAGLDRKARAAGKVYACPPAWDAVSDTLYTIEELELDTSKPLIQRAVHTKISGHLNTTLAADFIRYHEKASHRIEPAAVLENYKPGTAVYKQVQRLINRGDNAQLSTLMEGIAITFFGGDKWYERLDDVVPRLAQLYYDLPTTQSSLLTARLTAKGREWHPDNQYPPELGDMYSALAMNPVYREYKENRARAYAESDDESKAALAAAEAAKQATT